MTLIRRDSSFIAPRRTATTWSPAPEPEPGAQPALGRSRPVQFRDLLALCMNSSGPIGAVASRVV